MEKLKVLSIFGTRPEAVKMAPVIRELCLRPKIESKVCVTAQHREMLDQVLDIFDIVPDIDLNLMQPNQQLAHLTAEIFTRLDPILEQMKPDWILVQGDTTTVMAAATLAYYRRIHVGHVEAGLRTGDKWQPFPEEMNRKVTGVLADLHFAPTFTSRNNLLREGVEDWRISITGNPVVDALYEILKRAPGKSTEEMLRDLKVLSGERRLVLVTAHRRENFGSPLENICQALRMLAEQYEDQIQLVYPVHLNPNVQEPVYRTLDGIENITLLPPQPYLSMVHLLKSASLVLTDSGGIQEEATALQIPTLVMRQVTERPEGIEAGILKLVGTDRQRIVDTANEYLQIPQATSRLSNKPNPFGDGHAAQRIVDALLAFNETTMGTASRKLA
jgi:UDP-N-acetylglucosamine 2-epimerase (non-hydrolysing)